MNIVTEIWKDIPETNGGYQASSEGRIRSTGKTFARMLKKQGKILSFTVGKYNKYASLCTWNEGKARRVYVHQLVASAFIGPCPKGKEVNHLDGNRLNNKPDNLEYVTRSENNLHSYRKLGRQAAPTYGEKHHNAKMTWETVGQLREDYKVIKVYSLVAKKYGITWTTARSIIKYETWNKEKQMRSEKAQGMVSLI